MDFLLEIFYIIIGLGALLGSAIGGYKAKSIRKNSSCNPGGVVFKRPQLMSAETKGEVDKLDAKIDKEVQKVTMCGEIHKRVDENLIDIKGDIGKVKDELVILRDVVVDSNGKIVSEVADAVVKAIKKR